MPDHLVFGHVVSVALAGVEFVASHVVVVLLMNGFGIGGVGLVVVRVVIGHGLSPSPG
ncbi:hypothetical protein [Leifsonia sp. 22587]|uniref:hypothetical protein n=1 Tax=Leifsonia sp. 22587 TaxID=3453946 RepID=UPI003F850A59